MATRARRAQCLESGQEPLAPIPGVGVGRRASNSGRHKLKVVPWFGSDATLIWPRCSSTTVLTTFSPSPLPCSPLVVKNGVNKRSRNEGGRSEERRVGQERR